MCAVMFTFSNSLCGVCARVCRIGDYHRYIAEVSVDNEAERYAASAKFVCTFVLLLLSSSLLLLLLLFLFFVVVFVVVVVAVVVAVVVVVVVTFFVLLSPRCAYIVLWNFCFCGIFYPSFWRPYAQNSYFCSFVIVAAVLTLCLD